MTSPSLDVKASLVPLNALKEIPKKLLFFARVGKQAESDLRNSTQVMAK